MRLCSSPLAQYLARKDEIDRAIRTVLDSGRYILGEEVGSFEREFAAFVGASFAVGVGSGTDALHLALQACGIGPGDEVITVAHTAVATVAAIEMSGAAPVLVDIEPEYFTMDPSRLESVITPRARAIVPVHLYGQAADLAPIREIANRRGLSLIEDCAQAHGAVYRGRPVGSWGELACFSFYPTKNLGALGDGGAVVSSDRGLAERVAQLREYGWTERYVSRIPGRNSRLDELQASILRVKLRYLAQDNEARARIADLYDRLLAGAPLVLPKRRENASHVFHLYVVRSSRRDDLRSRLEKRGVGTLVHYPQPVHLQPAYRGRLRGRESLPETERAAREVLSLPIYPELSGDDVRAVADAVRSCAAETA